MYRPPIEAIKKNWRRSDTEDALCDYALALEREKAELERKVVAVRKAVDKDRFLCGLCVAMKADIEQALKEEP